MCTILEIIKNPYISGIIGSLIAGFLTIGILELYKYYKLRIQNEKFNKIFGSYDNEKLHLILASLEVRPDITAHLKTIAFPEPDFTFIKYGGSYIKSSKLFAYCDTVSLKHLMDLVSSVLGTKSLIASDDDLKSNLDLSFISFGGNSFYCQYVLSQPDNMFYSFKEKAIVSNKDGSKVFQLDNTLDYGFIIKYKHINFPNRVWIIVAGLAETGTRGAAWYLSKNWRRLSETYEEKPFGLVVKVNHGIDESAILIDETS
jgi:hypothetical protein